MKISKLFITPKGNGIVRQMKQNQVAINQELALFGSAGIVTGLGASAAKVENAIGVGAMVPVFGSIFSATGGNIRTYIKNIIKLRPEYNKIVDRAQKIYG